jgi:hypothetical protein
LLVSKAHQNTIVISQDNPCCIISDNFESDYIYESFHESSNESEKRETRIDVSDESDEIDEELNISQRLSSWILSICTKKYKFVTVNKFEN